MQRRSFLKSLAICPSCGSELVANVECALSYFTCKNDCHVTLGITAMIAAQELAFDVPGRPYDKVVLCDDDPS